jgi:hypothetical protein
MTSDATERSNLDNSAAAAVIRHTACVSGSEVATKMTYGNNVPPARINFTGK